MSVDKEINLDPLPADLSEVIENILGRTSDAPKRWRGGNRKTSAPLVQTSKISAMTTVSLNTEPLQSPPNASGDPWTISSGGPRPMA